MSQLAGEVLAARLDGTMPRDLSLTQVVAGVGGRVLLLDEPCEPEVEGAERFSTEADGLRAFFQVLVCVLATGTILGTNEAAKRKHLVRLPVKDYDVLDALWDPSRDPLDTIASIAARLADDPAGPVEIRPGSRLKHILGVSLVGALTWMALLGVASGFRDAFYDDRPPPRLRCSGASSRSCFRSRVRLLCVEGSPFVSKGWRSTRSRVGARRNGVVSCGHCRSPLRSASQPTRSSQPVPDSPPSSHWGSCWSPSSVRR